MKKEIEKYYQYLYNKVYDSNEYIRFNPTQKTMISNFLEDVKKKYTIDKEWIFNFLSYQFQNRIYQKTKTKIRLNWVIGKVALSKWESKPSEYTWILRRFWKKYRIVPPEIKKPLKRTYTELYKEYSFRERNRFKEDRKYLHCNELGLFENDKICKQCKFYKNCNYQNEL